MLYIFCSNSSLLFVFISILSLHFNIKKVDTWWLFMYLPLFYCCIQQVVVIQLTGRLTALLLRLKIGGHFTIAATPYFQHLCTLLKSSAHFFEYIQLILCLRFRSRFQVQMGIVPHLGQTKPRPKRRQPNSGRTNSLNETHLCSMRAHRFGN